jgi:hypothetical protein
MEPLAFAIRVSRAQLNRCSELSQAGHHNEARLAAREVQECIAAILLPEALKNAVVDRKAADLVKEPRVLQCAALLAQALDDQDVAVQQDGVSNEVAHSHDCNSASSSSASTSGSTKQKLYAEAKELAESFLPTIHPMVALTRSLCAERTASMSPSKSVPLMLPSLSPSAGRHGKKFSPKTSPSGASSKATCSAGLPANHLQHSPEPTARVASPLVGSADASAMVESEGAMGQEARGTPPSRNELQHVVQGPGLVHCDDSSEHHHDPDEHYHDEHREPRNIFAEYIADYNLEQQMSKPWFNNRQDELRKHVVEQARFVRLQDKGKNKNDLSNPKFTSYGHKLQTKVFNKENKTRSEPALLEQVKMAGIASPEAFLTSKLRLTLDPSAKPMIQPGRRRRRGAFEA